MWLRITVARSSASSPTWLLELRSPLLNDVTLYLPQQDGGYKRQVAGNRQHAALRDIAYRQPVFRVDLPPDQPVTLYLRIHSASTMRFSMVMWSPGAFISAMAAESLLFGLFFAAHVILLVSSVWFYRVTRNPSFGLFGLSVLVNLLTVLGAEGYLYQYLLPGLPVLSNALYLSSWLLGTPVGTLFAAQYLGLFESPWRRSAICFVWLTLGLAVHASLPAAAPRRLGQRDGGDGAGSGALRRELQGVSRKSCASGCCWRRSRLWLGLVIKYGIPINILTGYATLDRDAHVDALAQPAGFEREQIAAGDFVLTAFARITRPDQYARRLCSLPLGEPVSQNDSNNNPSSLEGSTADSASIMRANGRK